MSGAPYTLDASTGMAATLGLIVLQVDETIEGEVRRLLPQRDIAIFVSRVPSGAELTHETIGRMEIDLPAAASLLPQTPVYDAVGYACTSGATLLGRDRVAELIRSRCQTDLVLDPLGAVIADCHAQGISRIAMVSPYTADIGAPVAGALEDAGIKVTRAVVFNEAVEANVARISTDSVASAARDSLGDRDVDAVFLSCTNLRTLDLIAPLEAEFGMPVLSSNLCLARSLARAAGTDVVMPGPDAQWR